MAPIPLGARHGARGAVAVAAEKPPEVQGDHPVDFNKLLTYDPLSGVLTQRGSRVVVTGSTLLGSLRRSLLEAFPLEQIRARYLKAGYDQGFQDALAIAQTIPFDEDLDFVKIGAALTLPAGRARMDIERVDFRLAEGVLSAHCRFQSSFEAANHLRAFGRSKEGVCWILCGYAQGFVEALLDKPVIVVEYRCLASGHPDCALLITTDPAEASALEAQPAVRGQGSPLPAPAHALSNEKILEAVSEVGGPERARLADFFARKDAELERSRLKYRALLDASPDAVLEINAAGRILVSNERSLPLLGLSPQDLLERPLASVFVEDDRRQVEAFLSNFAPDTVSIFPRARVANPKGEARTVEIFLRPMGPGAATALVEIRDITERMRLEDELRDREARLRAIFDNAADGVIVWDERGVVVEANKAAEGMLGRRAGTLKGMAVDNLLHVPAGAGQEGRGRAKPGAPVRAVSALGPARRWVGQVALIPRTGPSRPAIASVTPLKDGRGSGSHLALIKDLAELKALREELRAERDKTAAVVGAISDPLVIFNAKGEVEWSNDPAVFAFGRSRLVQGTPCHLLLCGGAVPCPECPVEAFERQTQNPGTVRLRRSIRTTDGRPRPFELTLRRIPGSHGPATALAIFRDVTDESGSERRIRQRLRRDDLNLELSALLLSARATGEMLEKFADRLASAFDLTSLCVLLRGPSGWLVPALVFHGGAVLEGVAARIPPGTIGIKEVLSGGAPHLIRDVEKSAGGTKLTAVLEREGSDGSNTLYLAPVVGRAQNILGLLVAGHRAVDAFEDADLEFLQQAASRLGLALEGALLAEANQRVLRLQEALLAQGDLLGREADLASSTRRFLEIMCDSLGALSAGLVYLYPDRQSVRRFLMHAPHGSPPDSSAERVAIDKCPLLGSLLGSQEVTVLDVPILLAAERQDPILGPFLSDDCDCLVVVPTGVAGQAAGWIVIALPSSARVSTSAEVDVLRNLAQQTRLAVVNVLSQGRLGELRDLVDPAPRRGP